MVRSSVPRQQHGECGRGERGALDRLGEHVDAVDEYDIGDGHRFVSSEDHRQPAEGRRVEIAAVVVDDHERVEQFLVGEAGRDELGQLRQRVAQHVDGRTLGARNQWSISCRC